MAISRRFCTSGCLQYTLLAVLLLTLVFNIAFVLDNSNLFNKKFKKIEDKGSDFSSNRGFGKLVKDARKLRIEARSSKSSVYVSVDGLKVYENSVDGDLSRGIHIVVINEVTGTVMAKRIFDTYLPKEEEAMVLFLNMITDGRIVLFMIKDDGTMNLKRIGRDALKNFGSRFADTIGWRSSWAFISKKRNTWLAEAHQKTSSAANWGSPVVVQTSITLSENTKGCDWGSDQVALRRKTFCAKYEGYGSVCSCTNPAPINLHGEQLPNNRVKNLPIAVIASNRPHYLFRMLRGLLSTPGVNPEMVTIFIDGFYDEPSAIAELFQVSVVEHMPICSKNCRISQHYKRSLYETFTKHEQAEYMIILEEDLDVSKDLMDFFSQLLPVYRTDESIYCISAWNDQGYEHSSHDPSMLYRVETMPGLGWVLKKTLFMNELYPKWPGSDKFWDWDMWMRMDGNRKGRECIIPDISRTYHFGAKGLNMNAIFQDMYFTKHALNTRTGNNFNISTVYKDAYEELVESQIRTATVLDHTQTPCSSDNFVPVASHIPTIYVLYIKQDQAGDYETWNNVARCLKLWDLDVRGFHKQMWRFWINENQLFVVGSASPYVKFKPQGLTPVFIKKRSRKNRVDDEDDEKG